METENKIRTLEEFNNKIGWYQNGIGGLFYYDGVIWDSVPEDGLRNLEYLGDGHR